MDIKAKLCAEFPVSPAHMENIIKLIDDGNTIPFIARYRKEQHGACDDQVLRDIADRLQYLRNLEKKKEDYASSIEEQGKMTPEIAASLEKAETLAALEDIYRPFKQKRRTRATIAKEKGLEPLAVTLLTQLLTDSTPEKEAEPFVDAEKGVESVEDALKGAADIIAETMSDSPDVRKELKALIFSKGIIHSEAKTEEDSVYSGYYDYSESVGKIPPHRILAINRGEKENFLKVSIQIEDFAAMGIFYRTFVVKGSFSEQFIKETALDSYTRLVFPSVEREIRNDLTEKASEQAIKMFGQNLKPLLMQPQRFLTLHTELLLHFRTEIRLIASDYRYDLLNVLPDDLFQHNGTDIMSAALVLVGTMGGADEEVLPLFKIAGGGVVELLLAVVAEHQTGEHIALARCRSAVPLLPDLLHLIKDFQRDDCRVGVIENLAILHWIFPLLLIPDGVGVGLEIDRAACVLHVFEDVSNGAFVPAILVLRGLMRCFSALPLFVGGGILNVPLFQQSGDLTRSFSLHAECKDPLHDLCRFLVNHPFLRIARVTLIAVGNVGGQALSTLTLCLVDGTDFAAGIFGKKLVKPVLDACHVAVGAVGVNGVEVVVDGNIPHAVLRKRVVDIKPCQRGITTES